MKRFTAYTTIMMLCVLFTGNAQPTCDFATTLSSPVLTWYNTSGSQYDFSSNYAHPWKVINTSGVGSPTGSPYVLHTDPYYHNYSPQWITSQALSTFNWEYNQLQWSFWFGRRSSGGHCCNHVNGGSSDRSIVWLYINQRTNIHSWFNPWLEGIKITWHHDFWGNKDGLRLSEVRYGMEYVLGDVLLIDGLNDTEWGTTVRVLRIPGGEPTGSTVRYQVWLSTPDVLTPNFSNYLATADYDPIAASSFLRIDTTLTNPWMPTSNTTYMGIESQYTNSYSEAAEYNQLCVTDLGPAPVELTSFTANYRNSQVLLNWATATENNNLGFEIQRSIEHNGNWESIAFVDGQGNSSSPTKYSYTDNPNFDGANSIAYRLKQVDRDGSADYSNTILVSVSAQATDVLYNYPNPFNPSTNISFNLQNAGTVSLMVFNTAGEVVQTLYNQASLSAGYHTASFNGTGLPSGTYFYRLITNAGTRTNTMVLSK